jgi:glycosyltransferase involved in cell wall biosynthesis
MGHNIKIAMLSARYYPIQGGAEIQCRRLAQELSKTNTASLILTQKLSNLRSREVIDNLPVYRVGLPVQGKIGSLFYLCSGLWWLIRHRALFDLIHAHLASAPAVLGAIASLIVNKPVILKIAGSRQTGDIATSSSTWYGRLKLYFIRNSIDHFVCPSDEIKKELILFRFPENKIKVIPNGIDIDKFSPAAKDDKILLRKKLAINPDAKVVLFTGRLEPGKGLEILLDAWEHIEQETAAIKPCLIVLGTGSLFASLSKRASRLRSVTFQGWQDDVLPFIKASDIFVLPSSGEGLPNALIEAMSCGLACISTNIGGVNEIITSGESGILINPGDGAELYRVLQDMINSPESAQSLGKAARKFVENNLSLKMVGKSYLNLYQNTLEA